MDSGFISQHEINLIDYEQIWKGTYRIGIAQTNSYLDHLIKTNKTDETDKHAFLQTQLRNLTGTPVLLALEYTSKSPKWNSKFYIEIRGINDQTTKYLKPGLMNTKGNLTDQLFILPATLIGKSVELRLGIVTATPGEYLLCKKSFYKLVFNSTKLGTVLQFYTFGILKII